MRGKPGKNLRRRTNEITYTNRDNIDEIIDNTILNNNAQPNPSTVNPRTSQLVKSTRSALMTNVNKPNVIIVIGNDNRINTGLTIALRIPKTSAIINAVPKFATCMPCNR